MKVFCGNEIFRLNKTFVIVENGLLSLPFYDWIGMEHVMELEQVDLSEEHRVLLIEDSPTEALLLQAVLEETDHPRFRANRVGCLAEAIGYLDTEPCDVVILDLTLPDSKGLDTFITLHERFPVLPVVVVTANASKDLALKAIQIGAQDYIVKEQVENIPLALSLRFAIERKRSENEVIQQKRNLDSILHATPIGMTLIDEEMVVRMANQAISDMAGSSDTDLIGGSLGQALSCMHLNRGISECGIGPHCVQCVIHETCSEVLRTREPISHLETQFFYQRDAEEHMSWFDICCSPVVINHRQHIVLALNDITAMMEAQEIKSRLMSMVSHELRSPLGAMKEATEIVLDELPGPLNDEQLKMLEIVKRNLLRLHRLTTDFLDVQKLKSGKMSFEMQDGDIKQIVEEVCQTMQSTAQTMGLSLTVQICGDLPVLKFDKDRLVQVLINLTNNALKFTEVGGVTLITSRHGDQVHIAVRDSGCGMRPEEIPHLFEEFHQLTNTKSGGTGLGLAIAKKIITEHQGTIEVESELGQGTTMTVILPIQVESDQNNEATPETIATPVL